MAPNYWVPLEFLSLSLICMEPPAICQLQLKFPTPALVSAKVSAPVSCDSSSLPVSLSNSGGSSLSCDLPSLTDLKRVDFQVCSVFYLLLGQRGDF